jgi:TIR domain-containing protein
MPEVSLIGVDRDDWAKALREAIAAAAARNLGVSDAVTFTNSQAGTELVICLGSKAFASDSGAKAEIHAALARGVRVLPVVSALPAFKSEMPKDLHGVNGLAWGNPGEIAEEVLRHLGLTERDRRIFLSYLRAEGTPITYQLYEELHRRRFSVFVDTFEIEHGEWVQDRIEQALHHTSFVLLLYSPSVETSEWIEKEINFAMVHELGLMALALPGSGATLPFKMTPEDRIVPLSDKGSRPDLEKDGTLTPDGLERICLEIEQEHADRFRARRERLLQDLGSALGGKAIRVGTQSLRYQGAKSEVFLRVSPRPPEARDLYMLDGDCPIKDGDPQKNRVVVGVKGGYRENRELTDWVCDHLSHKVKWLEPAAICADPGVLEK